MANTNGFCKSWQGLERVALKMLGVMAGNLRSAWPDPRMGVISRQTSFPQVAFLRHLPIR